MDTILLEILYLAIVLLYNGTIKFTGKANAALTILEDAKPGERKQTPKYANAYSKYFILILQWKLATWLPVLFYHIFGLHTFLSSPEHGLPISQQYTSVKFEVEATSVKMFKLHF